MFFQCVRQIHTASRWAADGMVLLDSSLCEQMYQRSTPKATRAIAYGSGLGSTQCHFDIGCNLWYWKAWHLPFLLWSVTSDFSSPDRWESSLASESGVSNFFVFVITNSSCPFFKYFSTHYHPFMPCVNFYTRVCPLLIGATASPPLYECFIMNCPIHDHLQGRIMSFCLCTYGVGTVCWLVDQTYCAAVQVLHLHAFWHLCVGCAAYYTILSTMLMRLGSRKEHADLMGNFPLEIVVESKHSWFQLFKRLRCVALLPVLPMILEVQSYFK